MGVAVSQLVHAQPCAVPVLSRFHGVYVYDGFTITLPAARREIWPGFGGIS
jgi:hypothetical protein